jgi:surface polysaccharide O-acyltransferase-like enzyme
MEEKITVPYIVYESSMARAERQHKRLWIALIVAVVMIVVTNIAWLYVWNSYEYVGDETTYTQEGEGVNIIGDRNRYESDDNTQDEIPQEEKRTE